MAGTSWTPCWQTAERFEEVLAFYRSDQGGLPGTGWRLLPVTGNRQLAAQRDQVRVLLQRPEDAKASGVECPADAIYVLTYTLHA
jgi:hypothetical protein